MSIARAALLLSLAGLGACDTGPAARDSSPPPRIFDTQRDALDKAKGVQETVRQAGEQQRLEQEEQTK